MRNPGFLWIMIGIMVVLDVYVFQAIKLIAPASPKWRYTIFGIYWLISILCITLLIMLPNLNLESYPKPLRTYVMATIVGLFFSKLITSIFLLIDDIRRGAMWIIGKLFSNPSVEVIQSSSGITRSTFMTWMGIAIGGTLFGTLVYGFTNKYRYHLNRIRLAYGNLPAAFKGMKIVHISDIHSGSFMDKQAVQKGIDKIMSEKPDLILFTGDLVNDRSTEMDEYMGIFNQLKAPMGVYSTLGNHDYGDYVRWDSEKAKHDNLERLKEVHRELGWRLLMNEHVVLEKGTDTIALLGVENWSSKGRFPKYGKMTQAYPGSEKHPFKILMSHDPSHWDAEVRTQYKDIDLMLSGHTHGMQFGVELPGFKWSPVQYMYKQWAGLYEEQNQKLYINRGFGFIGYPGRVGILPEITVIELG
ncbi:MAG: metallophosphoesterase [Chitinophagaceae bacterium]|nr:metallophosphoesterase [Chitinophagaceae bacterium]